MALRPDLLGASSDPVEFSWDADDVLLYALAVGAGQADPTDELALTTENSAGTTLQVLPSFANIITRRARVYPRPDEEDPRVLHAEQAFRVHGPIPTAGRAHVTASVVALEDKRSGVLVRTLARAVDADSGAPLADVLQTIMVRGETAPTPPPPPTTPDGARGTLEPQERSDAPLTDVVSPPGPIPDRAPDRTVAIPVPADQALLYRLTGDRNPLHSDPAFAREAGFDRPILHGMCTYGFAARVLVDDSARLTAMHARFTRPVLPGDALEVAVWDGEGGVHFRTTRDGEPVLDQGWAEIHTEIHAGS